jgi:hypothetical protein
MIAPVMRPGVLVAMLLVGGCADGLVYGERTSFNLASVRLNDDPAEPVVIKLGFHRDVVLVAPPLGGEVVEKMHGQTYDRTASGEVVEKVVEDGQTYDASGEAVSQFSTFKLMGAAPFLKPDEPADLLAVRSRFASGHAALAIAGDPKIVGVVLGFRPIPLRGDEADALVKRLSECVNSMDQQQLHGLAAELGIALTNAELGSDQLAKRRITDFVDREEDIDKLREYQTLSKC